MGKALVAAGLVCVYGLSVVATLAPLDNGLGVVLGLFALLGAPVLVGVGILKVTGRVMLLWLAILGGMFAAVTVSNVVPAMALGQVGERVTCRVVDWDLEGRKGRKFEYTVTCPGGTPTVVKTNAITWELGQQAVEKGQPLQVIRDPSGWWKPDTVQSNEVVRASLPRWLGMLALPVVLLYPVAFPTPTPIGPNP
jgi:hypothetical protein